MERSGKPGFRRWGALLSGVLLAVAGCTTSAPVERSAGSAVAEQAGRTLPLWEITDNGGAAYLLGSVHLLRPEVYPLDDAIYEAFDRSRVVAFELDFDELMAAAPMMMQRGMYQDGTTLRDVVPEELYEETADRLVSLGMPPQMAESMKPWMASLMLSNLVLQQGGYDAASGIDLHFHERATQADLDVVGLETLEEQLSVFDGLDRAAQAEMLRSTLEQLDDTVAELDRATELWQAGDAEALAEMFIESMGDQPEVLEALLYQRNRNWVPKIEELVATGDTTMVIVGMGHLIGEGSVVDLLRERGYDVRQLRAELAGAGM